MVIQDKLGIDERINEAFQPISNFWEGLILHEFFGTGIPTIIFLLVGGAAFFTLYFGFINIRGFGLSLRTVMGKYDGLDKKRKDSGEVSHFQALATAVSGTVGNGNIAGVAMAIAIGGPGATFWMILCGLLGMSSKFVECTLGVKYREGFIKNRYIGRTFIMPGQSIRKRSVAHKLSPIEIEFKNKNILLVDDSIVRGNTSKKIIEMVRKQGAKRVYFASAAPPVRHQNVYGIDMPATKELVAHGKTIEQVRLFIGADELIYQDIDDLRMAAHLGNPKIVRFEDSVFTGEYCAGKISEEYLSQLENNRPSQK